MHIEKRFPGELRLCHRQWTKNPAETTGKSYKNVNLVTRTQKWMGSVGCFGQIENIKRQSLITLASDGDALTGLWFDGQKYFAGNIDDEIEEKDLPVFAQARQWLDIYFSGHDPGFIPALKLDSTPFRRVVWEILLTIPFGKTMTYGEIADCIAEMKGVRRMSAQAVGHAVGHNPISLIIPCHRVIGADGSMTGYAGGIDRKIKLLEMERADTYKFNQFH